jgi:adenylate cyclase
LLFFFDEYVLDTDRRELRRGDGLLSVEPKVLDLLVYLIGGRDRVVSKEDLIAGVWMGRVVSDSALTSCINAARVTIGDSGESQRLIKTLPRKGVRFVGAVREGDSSAGPEPPSVAVASPKPALALPDKPSVAVLPFANLSNDPDQEYFADGLTEDIITALSRLRWFFVIARNSTFAYKGEASDVRQIARDLGVRYVLEGSVRKAGDRLRVTSQLIDASTGAHVWAERYDRVLADIFAVQDEITASVVASIEPQLYAAEHLRFQRKPPENLDAWGYVMRAIPLAWTNATEKGIETAAHLLAHAIEIDPNYARANSLLAWTNAVRAAQGWGDPSDALAAALLLAQRAIEQDRWDPWGHFAAGYVHTIARRFKPAVEELREAIECNPSLTHAHSVLALAYCYGGRPDECLAELAIATRLNPRDQDQNAIILSITGLYHLMARRFSEAVEFERRAVQASPSLGTAWRTLAAAAGLAGDSEIAASALAEAKRLQPSLSLEWVEKYHPIVRAEDRATYLEGLQKAGLR